MVEAKRNGNIVPRPIAVGEHVELALLGPSLAKEYLKLAIANQDRLRAWFSWAKQEQTLEQTTKYLEQVALDHETQRGIHFGIFFNGKLIGQLSLTRIDAYHRSLNAGGWIDRNYEGKGHFFKVAEAALNYVFMDLGFNRVEVRAVATNERSHNLISILRKEGTLREAHREYDRFMDVDVYGLLRSEWPDIMTKRGSK